MHRNALQHICLQEHDSVALESTATHCNTLQHTAAHCSTLQHTAAHCNTLQYTKTLQHTATHCNSGPARAQFNRLQRTCIYIRIYIYISIYIYIYKYIYYLYICIYIYVCVIICVLANVSSKMFLSARAWFNRFAVPTYCSTLQHTIRLSACCSVLQRVAVCCSVLQCVAVWCSVVHCVAECYLQERGSTDWPHECAKPGVLLRARMPVCMNIYTVH